MACHLQILAFSDWLAVSLPIEYHEVTRGLRWLIPHVKTPWQDDSGYNTATDFGSGVEIYVPTILQSLIKGRRRLLEETGSSGRPIGHRGRMLGANTTLYGPAFGADDYKLYFLVALAKCIYSHRLFMVFSSSCWSFSKEYGKAEIIFHSMIHSVI